MDAEEATRAPLATPALGAGHSELDELVTPCGDESSQQDWQRVPQPVVAGRSLALTFSGGGFRATLAALGVVRFLADIDRLRDVRVISSVSGGSIANGMLACTWRELIRQNFRTAMVDRLVIDPIVDSVSESSLKEEILWNGWRLLLRTSSTELLAEALDRRFFHNRWLADVDPGCRFIINAANLVTGVRFAFEREVLGDYVTGLAPTAGTGIHVATAVAASAAVPGAFAPLRIAGVRFPCERRGQPRLVDGGAYDNTGLQAVDDDWYAELFLIAMNAGGVFRTGRWGGLPIIGDLVRANSLLYRQSTGLRTRWMVARFQAYERAREAGVTPDPWMREGILMALASKVKDDPRRTALAEWRKRFPETRTWNGHDLSQFPTVFDRLDRRLCRLLVYRGWWLTGACLAAYYPGALTKVPTQAPPLD